MSAIDRLQAKLARLGGHLWRSYAMLAIWPWPAMLVGKHHGRFTWDDYRCFTRNLLPGDFLITKSEPFVLSNMAISGTAFKHGAVYTGPCRGWRDQNSGFIMKPHFLYGHKHSGKAEEGVFERTVTHAISEGVVTQDLGEVLFHADYAAVIRPWTTLIEAERIVEAALGAVGLDYNFDFKPSGPPALYCTELLVHCLQKVNIAPPPMVRRMTSFLGGKSDVTLADYFVRYPMICSSVSCSESGFADGSACREPLRVAIKDADDAAIFTAPFTGLKVRSGK